MTQHCDILSPIPETDGITGRPTSSIENNTHQNQTNDGDDLDQGEPKFHLSVDLDAEEVGRAHADETDGDPYTIVDGRVPVVDDDGAGDHLD